MQICCSNRGKTVDAQYIDLFNFNRKFKIEPVYNGSFALLAQTSVNQSNYVVAQKYKRLI